MSSLVHIVHVLVEEVHVVHVPVEEDSMRGCVKQNSCSITFKKKSAQNPLHAQFPLPLHFTA